MKRVTTAVLLVLALVLMNTGAVFAADEDVITEDAEVEVTAEAVESEEESPGTEPAAEPPEMTEDSEGSDEPEVILEDPEDTDVPADTDEPEDLNGSEDPDVPDDTEESEELIPEDPETTEESAYDAVFSIVLSRFLAGGYYAEVEDLKIPASQSWALLDYLEYAGYKAAVYCDYDFTYVELVMLDDEDEEYDEDDDADSSVPEKEPASSNTGSVTAPADDGSIIETASDITVSESSCEPALPKANETAPTEPVGGIFGLMLLVVGAVKALIGLF